MILHRLSLILRHLLACLLLVALTMPAPLVAISTERCATSADSAELRDTWLMLLAISVMRVDAVLICCA